MSEKRNLILYLYWSIKPSSIQESILIYYRRKSNLCQAVVLLFPLRRAPERAQPTIYLITSTLGLRCNHMLILAVHTLALLCQNSHSPFDINSHMRMLATHVSAGRFHLCWQPTGHRYSRWDGKCQCSLTAKTHPLTIPTRHIPDPDRWTPFSLCTGSLAAYALKLFLSLSISSDIWIHI